MITRNVCDLSCNGFRRLYSFSLIRSQHWQCSVAIQADLFTYDHLKANLTSKLKADECLKLANFFALPQDQTDTSFNSGTSTENLLHALEEKGAMQPFNVDKLTEALTDLEIKSSCCKLVDFYEKTRTSVFYKETIQKLDEENQEMKKRLETANIKAEENKAQVQNLQRDLQGSKQLLQRTKDLHKRTDLVARNAFRTERDQYQMQLSSLKENLESTKQAQRETEKALLQTKEFLEEALHEKNTIKAEHEQCKLQSSIKSMTLEEVPVGDSPQIGTEKTRPTEVRRGSYHNVSSPTSEYLPESAIENEFAKLLVKVSVKLTNDNCVMLATYFNFPESKIDLIRKDNGTPGITMLSVMKERNIINMYDVSNLQQALVDIELRGINETLIKPYQRRIDPSKYAHMKAI